MKKIYWITILTLSALATQAVTVNFDLSASYDYDAYVTGEEIANNIDVDGTLGGHSLIKSAVGYAHLVDPGTAGLYAGIPSTTINGGEFELAAGLTGDKFGTATGTTAVSNSVGRLSTDGSVATVRTATMMLEAGQQAKYSDFNLLVNGNRYGTRTVTMTALLEVKYVGDANWHTIWTESQVPTAGEPGGCFGGSMTGPAGTDSHHSAEWTAVLVNGDVSNGYYKNTTPASGESYMYKLATAATLDSNAVLEGFRLTASTTDAARYNDFILYAASGTLASGEGPTAPSLVFDNTTPAQFVQAPDVTTNLSFTVRNLGADATNVTVSLTSNGSYSWLSAATTTNLVGQILNGASDTSVFSVTIASNAPGGVYSDALTLNMTGTGTNGIPLDFSAQVSLEVLSVVSGSFMVDLSGDWNTGSARPTFTLPALTNTADSYIYNDGFAAPLITSGQAVTGGSYEGPTMYAAFRQYNVGGVSAAPTLRANTTDFLEMRSSASTVPFAAGEFNFVYVVKKANFYNGLNTGNVGFGSDSTFAVTTTVWTADSKSLRAVVQNGSTWYISQDEDTVVQSGAKTIVSNAASALWAVWDPTTDISAASLNFASTVAGSTFTDIQAVGVWASLIDGANNPDVGITSIQIDGVAVSEPPTGFALTGSAVGGNGTVSPSSTNVASGGSAEFAITADSYYRIASLTTNGAPVAGMTFDGDSTATNFTWSNVQAAGSLVATFTAQLASDPAGTPHAWLAQYGLTNFDADAVADVDLDGLDAWQEYIAGTDPTNSASSFRVVENPRNVLNWNAVSGRVYSVYWTTNLLSGFQALETNIPAPQASYTNVTAVPSAIYQLKVQMP